MTLAERLAAFTASLSFDALPDEVVDSVRMRALDVLGIALASSRGDWAPAVVDLAGEGGGECTVLGTARTASIPFAILVNGTLAHGLDFDDTHAASITHASAVILPTVLALAEAYELDGRTTVTAAVAGYEAITRIGMAASGAFHARGWHATAVCGAFAAALAAGRLQSLDDKRLTAALGLAGSFASGVMEHLEDGSWVKRLHPGWAGHSGALAAALARGGVPGPATILEGRFGLAFSVASAFVDGAVGIDTYAPARLTDERILALASRVRHVIDPDSAFPATFPGWLRVRLADGRQLEARVPHGRGGPDRPLPPEALVDKFRDNGRRALPAARLAALERAALEVDRLKSVRELMRLCRG